MPNRYKFPFRPGDHERTHSVRGAYLQNLINCVHICIQRGLYPQARRAWAILVRCPDVDWKERWYWGLFLLTEGADESQRPSAHAQSQSQYSSQRQKDNAADYLNKLRLQVKPAQKPAVLAELVLHLIHTGRYSQALEQLELFLVDHPYDKSAVLHSYAGLICFWLALPASKRKDETTQSAESGSGVARRRRGSASSSSSASVDDDEPPDEGWLYKARKHFDKALNVDPKQDVAREFIDMIDNPSTILTDEKPPSASSSEVSARSRAQSVDMLSGASSPRAFDLVSEADSLRESVHASLRGTSSSRASTPRARRQESSRVSRPASPQAPAQSFGAMSLDAEPAEPVFAPMSLDDAPERALESEFGLGFEPAWPRLAELQGLEDGASGLSRNASLADLAEVRSVSGSEDSFEEFSDDGSRTTDTEERSASPEFGIPEVDMSD